MAAFSYGPTALLHCVRSGCFYVLVFFVFVLIFLHRSVICRQVSISKNMMCLFHGFVFASVRPSATVGVIFACSAWKHTAVRQPSGPDLAFFEFCRIPLRISSSDWKSFIIVSNLNQSKCCKFHWLLFRFEDIRAIRKQCYVCQYISKNTRSLTGDV